MLTVKSAWRGMIIYLFSVVILTLGIDFVASSMIGSLPLPLRILVPSFVPAISSIIARLSTQEGFRDVSFRIRDRQVHKMMLIAWASPVALGLVTYGTAWLTGATRFGFTSTWYPFGSWGPEKLLGISVQAMHPSIGFVVRLTSCLLFSLVYCAWSFGMELGWRGYMLPKLSELKIGAPMFWTGLVWGLVYLPGMIRFSYGKRLEAHWISSMFFVVGAIGLSYILGYLRLQSGSIWPSVLGYATWSCVIGMAYDGLTQANPFWKGELYLLSVGLGAAALFFAPRPWKRV